MWRSYQLSFQAAQGRDNPDKPPRLAAVFEVFFDNLSLGVFSVETAGYVNLGTPRMIVGLSGRLLDDPATTNVDERLVRHDYLPFGEELAAGQTPLRNAAFGYAVRRKFTGKERDLVISLKSLLVQMK